MIIEVKDAVYKGILLVRVDNEDQNGWKMILGEDEYVFPYFQDAKNAIDEFIDSIIPKRNGKKL